MKLIVSIIILLSSTLNAQNLKLGFDFETHRISEGTDNETHILRGDAFPIAFHIILEYDLIENISLDTRLGRTIQTHFSGMEYSLGAKYKVYKSFFITSGVLLHSNEGGNISNGESMLYTSILMLYGGVGLNLSNVFAIEIKYYNPTSSQAIEKTSPQLIDNKVSWNYIKFKNMIRFGFSFKWPL